MKLAHFLLDLVFPPKCPFCEALLDRQELLCPDCQRDLPWLTGSQGMRRVELTEGCVSVLRYEGLVRNGVLGFKFRGKSARSLPFGTLLAQAVRDQWLVEKGEKPDLITWACLSPRRLRQRGYDQAGLLCAQVGKVLDLKVVKTLKKQNRPPQSGIQGEGARRANLMGAYVALPRVHLQGKTVLLVDDVVTTGTTLSDR